VALAGGGIDLYGTDRLNHTPRLRKGKAMGAASGDSYLVSGLSVWVRR
jgi:hypothetical protein